MSQPRQEILILGASGMLGVAWQRSLRADPNAPPYRTLPRAACDIADTKSVAEAITPADRGAIVVNCAAYTAVDQAETEEDKATLLNGTAVGVVARRCREVGAFLVHYSTDYVFDGNAPIRDGRPAPYHTDHPRDPINAYGRSKAVGEIALERLASGADGPSWREWLCLRTSWLYAPHGKNFVLTIANAARTKPVLRVVNDQRGRPTACDNLVRVTRKMLAARDGSGARPHGIHHACDSGECTWFEFAQAIVERVNASRSAEGPGAAAPEPCRVEPCSSAEFPRPAKRPAYSVLDLSRTEALIGPIRHWRVTLAHALDEALAAKPG